MELVETQIRGGDVRVFLVDNEINVASIDIKEEKEGLLSLRKWKAIKKGHGYGKTLFKMLLESRPRVSTIVTDGFSTEGGKNMMKIVDDIGFVIVEWRWSFGGGYGLMISQRYADWIIERQRRGNHEYFIALPDKMHSEFKKK